MRTSLFGYYLTLTLVFVFVVVLTQILHKNASAPRDYRFARNSQKVEQQQQQPQSDKLIQDYHQRTKKKQDTVARGDVGGGGGACGIGWNFVNNETGCVKNIRLPRVVDPALQDPQTNQCVDFYSFSCGAFDRDPFNAGKDSGFMYTHQIAANTMRFITSNIINSTAPDQSKIAGFHHACMEHGADADEFKRSATLQSLLLMVDQTIKSYGDLAVVWGRLQRYDTILPLELTFELDPSDSSRLIPMVKQSGLFDDQEMLDTPEHLADLTRRLAIIAPQKVALEWARQIVGIERAIVAKSARVAATNIIEYMERFHGKDDVVEDWKSHFSHLTFNISAFIEAANPGMSSTRPWMEAIQARPLWVYRPQFLEKMPELVHQFSLASWIVYTKHAILFHINNGNDAPRLNPESHYAYHRQYDSRYSLPWLQPRKFLMQPVEGHPSVFETPSPSPPLRSGTKDISTPTGASTPAGSRREALPELGQSSASKNEVCLSLTEAYLPVVLDNYFVNSYLPDNVKRRTSEVAARIKRVFVDMVRGAALFSFLPVSDRLAVAHKIESVRMQIGTPNAWPIDRSLLTVDPESYAESVLLIRKYHIDKNYRFFMGHVAGDLEVNGDTLFDGLISNANAYYQHQINTVIITAGLIQPPLFSALFDKVSIYSRFGVTIAHELAHSVDAVGILFDASGTYSPWLSDEARTLYLEKMRCLIEVYSVQTPLGNMHDGKRTLNENIADLLGFLVAFEAFSEDMGAEMTVQDQRDFFISYSQMYCEPLTRSQEMMMVAKRTHSLNSLRVSNLVIQHPSFDTIWDCSRYDRNNHLKNTCSLN